MHNTLFELLIQLKFRMRAPRLVYTRTPSLVPQSYRSHRSSGLPCEDVTELERNSAHGSEMLQNSQKFRVLWLGRTELT